MTKFAPAIFFAAFVAWCVWFVPPNMDEFSPFLRLACSYPHAHLNTFREGCHLYELDFGWFSYHRSYAYIGITPAAMYFPFWALWKSPGSFYLLGILSLVLFSIGLTRALRLPRRFAVIPLCYFPIAYLTIHDSGPIRLSLLSIPALVLLSEIAIRSRTRLQSLLAGAAAGAIMLVCVEEKIFFLLIAPLVVLSAAGCVWHDAADAQAIRRSLVRMAPSVLIAMVVFASGVGVLLFAGYDGPDSYFSYVTALGRRYQKPVSFQLSQIGYHSILWPMAGRRTFAADPLIKMTAPVWVLLQISIVYLCWRARAIGAVAIVLFAGAFLAAAATFVIAGTPIEAHHYVFLHVPLLALLMLAAARSTRLFASVVAYTLVSGVIAAVVLSASPVSPPMARERARMFAYFTRADVARTNVVNFSSWGGYYHQALFGDREQLVTYTEPLNTANAAQLAAVARGMSRNILTACLGCEGDWIAATFGTYPVTPVDLGLRNWRVFEVHVR